ncbi:MAG: chorismate-binding protein, partial [Polyangiaceae bacterium]|nr:chorismate-binding protein [Polyangiaceae bacterium]
MWCAPEEELRDPVEAALRLAGRPGLAWLDGDGGEGQGRYSFVGSDPVELRSAHFGDPLALHVSPDHSVDLEPPRSGPPSSIVPRWVGYLAYDAAFPALVAGPLVHARSSDPVVYWARYPALYVFDHATGRAFVCGDDERACAELRGRLQSHPAKPEACTGAVLAPDRADHLRAVEAVLEHIARGDVYQVNLARRFSASLEGEPLALFLAMRAESPVPFGFYLDTGRLAVLGRSMERFLRWEGPGGSLESRPIKGTVACSVGGESAASEALRADAKEHAEHAMIVDLVRNDLGRIAEVGSVAVTEVFEVEPYARLSHLVSTVRCRTRSDVR